MEIKETTSHPSIFPITSTTAFNEFIECFLNVYFDNCMCFKFQTLVIIFQ